MTAKRTTSRRWNMLGPILAFAGVTGLVCLIVFRPNHQGEFDRAKCQTALADQVTAADVVMSGSVFMIIPGGSTGVQVIIDPITVYKGSLSRKTITINAIDSTTVEGKKSADQTELHFQSGQPPYLLFLRRQSDGTYNTRTCDGSRVLGEGLSDEEQAEIESHATT